MRPFGTHNRPLLTLVLLEDLDMKPARGKPTDVTWLNRHARTRGPSATPTGEPSGD